MQILCALLLCLSYLTPQQSTDTVAIILSPESQAIILPRSQAEQEFKQLCAADSVSLVFDGGNLVITIKRSDAERILSDPNAVIDSIQGVIKPPVRQPTPEEIQIAIKTKLATDDQRLRALAAALNPMPDWPQFVVNNDPSVCNRDPKPIIPPTQTSGRPE